MQIAALRNLKLNISRAKLRQKAGKQRNRFYITDKRTSDKVVKSARLEEIRLTILQNLLKYHPESVDELAWGGKISKPETRNNLEPLGPAHRFSVPHSYASLCDPSLNQHHIRNMGTFSGQFPMSQDDIEGSSHEPACRNSQSCAEVKAHRSWASQQGFGVCLANHLNVPERGPFDLAGCALHSLSQLHHASLSALSAVNC